MLAALLLASVPQAVPAGEEPPFEDLGRAFLEALGAPAEPLRAAPAERGPAFLALLRGRYHALDLGAFELWIPRRALGATGALGPGLEPRAARGWARDLLALQRFWVELLLPRGAERAARLADLEALGAWAATLDRAPSADPAGPAGAPELERARAELRALFASPQGCGTPALLIATTRRQLVSLTSAAGLLFAAERERLWDRQVRAVGYTNPFWEVVAISLESGPEPGSDGLVGAPYTPGDVAATVVHRGAHILIERVLPAGPQWVREGLALEAGIEITGNDDSPCTGFWSRDQMANVLWLPYWLEADASPYREGPAASWFERELRPDRQGRFPIWDLDRSKVALHLSGPFLGGRAVERTTPPDEVLAAGRGVERGYAEFQRAYSAACVHWLSLQRVGDRPVLSWLVEFLRDTRRHAGLRPQQLVPTGLQMITLKTFGRSDDPERDLEAAFGRWLAAR